MRILNERECSRNVEIIFANELTSGKVIPEVLRKQLKQLGFQQAENRLDNADLIINYERYPSIVFTFKGVGLIDDPSIDKAIREIMSNPLCGIHDYVDYVSFSDWGEPSSPIVLLNRSLYKEPEWKSVSGELCWHINNYNVSFMSDNFFQYDKSLTALEKEQIVDILQYWSAAYWDFFDGKNGTILQFHLGNRSLNLFEARHGLF